MAALIAVSSGNHAYSQSVKPLRFDMGSKNSPVADGYVQVTDKTVYSPSRGFGWESTGVQSQVWNDLRDIRPFELYDFMMARFDIE